MPAVWTTPRTWVNGETPTGAMFNTHIRDDLMYLKDSPSFDGNVNVVGGVTASGLHITAASSFDGNVTIGDAAADTISVLGTVVGMPLKTYTETRTTPVIGGGALTLDCALGTYFKVTLNANCTVTISNAPAAARALGITVVFIADGTVRTITWPGSVVWPSGVAPTMSGTVAKRDVITLITEDGGATWFGVIVGQNY